MATPITPLSVSPMAARLGYLVDLQKAEDTYAEAWWTRSRPKRRASGQQSPLRGSFSSDEAPSLDGSSELPSPSSSFPSTPAEYVQEHFERAQKNQETYNSAWSTAVEKHILHVHDPHDPAIKLGSRARRSNLLAAQLDAFAKREDVRQGYYDAWCSPSIGDTLLVHEPRDPAIKIASTSTDVNLLAVQLQASAEQREGEDAYDEAWASASGNGSLRVEGSRKSATKIASENIVTNALAAQLRAAEDEALAEQAYVDAWSRYREITRYAQSIDAWKSYHLERLREESEYYDAWSDAAKKSTLNKPPKSSTKSKVSLGYSCVGLPQVLNRAAVSPYNQVLISQMAMFQDIHTRDEQYNETWAAYGQRHTAMAPAPVRSPRRRSRMSFSRSPRPAFMRRLPGDIASPEIPMLGFSAMDTLEDDGEYIKAWADKMKTTTITPANSLLLPRAPKTHIIPSSPKPKKRSEKGHFKWPEGLTEAEKVGLTTRGDLQPYLSSLLGKIVSFELVGQSELSISPDEASVEAPMRLVRRANLKCQNHVVCKVKASVSITSPPTARRYAQDPLPLFDALRRLGHAAVIQLEQVGMPPVNPETGRQAIWRKYSVVSGAFRCEVKETFMDRRMFSKDGCDFGKKVLIKDGLVMSPDGVDYLALPL
ncbi:unnamed protein product [Rhizoctonia solani]|uniref:Uncharacterized protein n=1 Tax=Rhizoctonia solani TaxID=456999 RepID=A0A8H3CGN9_9AGAM|nr:unnamed protein product [Rhizoctonia solani]